MSLRWYTVVVDCRDVTAQGRWWAEVFGWPVVREADDEVVIAPPRLIEATAAPADADWVVMADPEGNEFCVLSPPS
jgi:predicted enzyme related to lactoylglutathione lyase